MHKLFVPAYGEHGALLSTEVKGVELEPEVAYNLTGDTLNKWAQVMLLLCVAKHTLSVPLSLLVKSIWAQ